MCCWRIHKVPCLVILLLLALGGSPGAAASLEEIRARGRLIIATDATYPPFESIEGGEVRGFDVDLGNEIGKELGVRVAWMPMAWSGVFGALETRKCDLIMSGVTITEERKKGNGFSRPYFLSGQVIARRKGDTRIATPDDLRGKTVAVQQETTGQKAVEKLGLPRERISKFETLPDALMDLRNRKSDAVVADLPALRDIIRKAYPELEVAGGIFVQENVGVVARRGELELLAAINQALDRIMVDGRYARIYEQWLLEPVTTSTIAGLDRVKEEGTPVPARLLEQGKSVVATTQAPPAAEPPSGSSLTIRWGVLGEALPWLLQGARMTLYLTVVTLLLGVPAGLLIALARVSGFRPLAAAATVYVEVVRGTPLLMQIYVIYFVLPALGINLPQLASAITALSLNAAAYISEIFRAGIQSIDTGQMEAARSLGMNYVGAMRWVILPQTLRRVLPPLTNEAVALLKDSSLVSVIALSELMRVGTQFATNTGAVTTIYLAVGLIYLAMTLPLTHLVRYLEAKWQPVSRERGKVIGKQQAMVGA